MSRYDKRAMEALFLCALGRGPMLDQNAALRLMAWVDPYMAPDPELQDKDGWSLLDLYDEAYDAFLDYEERTDGD